MLEEIYALFISDPKFHVDYREQTGNLTFTPREGLESRLYLYYANNGDLKTSINTAFVEEAQLRTCLGDLRNYLGMPQKELHEAEPLVLVASAMEAEVESFRGATSLTSHNVHFNIDIVEKYSAKGHRTLYAFRQASPMWCGELHSSEQHAAVRRLLLGE